jgi:hypothetical protein
VKTGDGLPIFPALFVLTSTGVFSATQGAPIGVKRPHLQRVHPLRTKNWVTIRRQDVFQERGKMFDQKSSLRSGRTISHETL